MQEAVQACASLAPSDMPSGAAGGVNQTAPDAFTECMSENGVEVEDSLKAVTSLDQADPGVADALQVCAPLIQP